MNFYESIMEKYGRCQWITDEECQFMVAHYQSIIKALSDFGCSAYSLVLNDARRNLEVFEKIKTERTGFRVTKENEFFTATIGQIGLSVESKLADLIKPDPEYYDKLNAVGKDIEDAKTEAIDDALISFLMALYGNGVNIFAPEFLHSLEFTLDAYANHAD